MPDAFGPGPIVDGKGTVLGRHAGLVNYTVGQRRGLGLAAGRPLYVTTLDPSRNAVVVGGADEVEVDVILAEQPNFISIPALQGRLAVQAKIRHTHEPAAATIEPTEDGLVRVRFERAQRAPAPGQSVVFYRGDLVVGGGVIARAEVS
jgi:tRNA-specific 2-thiouridylase